jgi:hypothetical protein
VRSAPKVPDHREASNTTLESAVLREMNDRTLFSVCNDEIRFLRRAPCARRTLPAEPSVRAGFTGPARPPADSRGEPEADPAVHVPVQRGARAK